MEFGNHIKGTIIPAGTTPLQTASYYKPDSFPRIGLPYALNEHDILAQENYDNQQFTTCLAIRNTNCVPSLVLSASTLETGVYQAARYLSTNGEVMINSNSTVVFEAGESIVLEEGFVTGDEADFSTSLTDCGDASNIKMLEQRAQSTVNSDPEYFLNLVPNPATQYTWLEFEAMSNGEGKYLIYNQQGIILQQESISFQGGKNRQLLDLTQFESGLYYLMLVLENRINTEKIIVMRM
ncbi:MAG: T9SS type A sorting domain-containing protein [Saprospiraceae bacterium]|nr:T9SS type A sorting domain-containing protein [Saprospiraceae bacterium]